MMHVNDIAAGPLDPLDRHMGVIISGAEMLGRIERFDRRDQQCEFELQQLARFQLSRPAVGLYQDGFPADLFERAAALSGVVPEGGRGQLSDAPVEIHQRPAIVGPAQLTLQPGLDVADPKAVLVDLAEPLRDVGLRLDPGPRQLLRPVAAFSAHAHQVRGRFAPQGDLQSNVLQLHIMVGLAGDLEP